MYIAAVLTAVVVYLTIGCFFGVFVWCTERDGLTQRRFMDVAFAVFVWPSIVRWFFKDYDP